MGPARHGADRAGRPSFVAAFALGRRRGVVAKAALYLAGLAVSAALFLTLTVLLGVSGGIVVP